MHTTVSRERSECYGFPSDPRVGAPAAQDAHRVSLTTMLGAFRHFENFEGAILLLRLPPAKQCARNEPQRECAVDLRQRRPRKLLFKPGRESLWHDFEIYDICDCRDCHRSKHHMPHA